MGEWGGGEDSTIGRTKSPREQSLEHTFPLNIVGSISIQNCPLVEVGRGLQVDQCLSCRCWWACSFVQPESRKHTDPATYSETFLGKPDVPGDHPRAKHLWATEYTGKHGVVFRRRGATSNRERDHRLFILPVFRFPHVL